jgi:hypothetical protein
VYFLTWVSRYRCTNLYDIESMLKRTDVQTSMSGRNPVTDRYIVNY